MNVELAWQYFHRLLKSVGGYKYIRKDWNNGRWRYWYFNPVTKKVEPSNNPNPPTKGTIDVPDPKLSFIDKLKNFFGGDKEKAVEAYKTDYQSIGKGKPEGYFQTQFNLYFQNKEKVDEYFRKLAEKKVTLPTEKKETGNKKGAQINPSEKSKSNIPKVPGTDLDFNIAKKLFQKYNSISPVQEVKQNVEESKPVNSGTKKLDSFINLEKDDPEFKVLADKKIREAVHEKYPNVMSPELKALDGVQWSKLKNAYVEGLRYNEEWAKELQKQIYEAYSPGSWDIINNKDLQEKKAKQEAQDKLKSQYHNQKIGDVNISVEGNTAKLSFPYDDELAKKIKANYKAEWNGQEKKWEMDSKHLPKLEKVLEKYDTTSKARKEQAEFERKQKQEAEEKEKARKYREQQDKYAEQKKKWEEEKKERAAKERLTPKTYLNVPFSEKDYAKSHGAKWDADKKSWYIHNDKLENESTKKGLSKYLPTNTEQKPKVSLGVKDKDYSTREIQYHGYAPEKVGDIVFHNGEYKKIKAVNITHHPENELSNPYDYSKVTVEYSPIEDEADKQTVEKYKKQAEINSGLRNKFINLKNAKFEDGAESYFEEKPEKIFDKGSRDITDYYAVSDNYLYHAFDDFDRDMHYAKTPLTTPEAKEFVEYIKTHFNKA